MSQEPETPGAASWRRRHPVLSRSLLYGLGLVLAAVAAWLLVARGKVDRQDQLDYLAARLDALDVLATSDHTGDEIEKVLAEVFADGDLPAALRQRALRARSILHLKREEAEAALADLDAAARLAAQPTEAEGIALERAQALISGGRAEEAAAALVAMPVPGHPALAIWHAQLRARAAAARGSREEAVRLLDGGLEALPRPLPEASPALFSLTPWTPAEASLHATKELVDLAGRPLGSRPWERLLGLAPRDLLAAIEAAKALARGGHADAADRAWAWAVSLNGGQAPKSAVADPDLATLEKKRVEGLKVEGPGSR